MAAKAKATQGTKINFIRSMKGSLLMFFLLMSLIPLVIVTLLLYTTANTALNDEAFAKLAAAQGIKKGQIEGYFSERQGDMVVLMETVATLRREAFAKLNSVQGIKKAQIANYFAEREGDMGVLVETVGTLRKEAFDKLDAINAIKTNQIGEYFETVGNAVHVLKDNPTTVQAIQAFEEAFAAEGGTGGPLWSAVEAQYGPIFAAVMADYGYYDVFLLAEDGDVLYTVSKESDLGENLLQGSLKDSGLAHVFRATDSAEIAFDDFEPYAPSGNLPAAFVAGPVVDENGVHVGAIAIQVPLDQINAIMMERSGMGETGETYLVGPDKLMRSDSYLDPT